MRVINSHNTEAARAAIWECSDTVNSYVLVANTAQTVTIPAGATVMAFASTGNFYANFRGATAVVPTVNITNGTSSELNPTVRSTAGLSTISIISSATPVVTISFYNE